MNFEGVRLHCAQPRGELSKHDTRPLTALRSRNVLQGLVIRLGHRVGLNEAVASGKDEPAVAGSLDIPAAAGEQG